MAADQCGQERNRELISFREWAEVLARDTEVPDSRREEYRGAIIAFLGFCKRRHAGVSVILIQSYLSGLPEQERSGAREALRWWYRAAQGSGSACGLPSRVPCRVPTGTRPRFTVGTRQDGSPFSRRAPRAWGSACSAAPRETGSGPMAERGARGGAEDAEGSPFADGDRCRSVPIGGEVLRRLVWPRCAAEYDALTRIATAVAQPVSAVNFPGSSALGATAGTVRRRAATLPQACWR